MNTGMTERDLGGSVARRGVVAAMVALTAGFAAALAGLSGCAGAISAGGPQPRPVAAGSWAIAIHGGAGTIPISAPAAEREAYLASLRAALSEGQRRLAAGEPALDVVQAVVVMLEDDPLFNAGRGAAFTRAGTHELDASIMDGRTLRAGAVAGVRTVRNPVALARLVAERTTHVLLAGEGAESFASAQGVPRVENPWFGTDRRRRMLDDWRRQQTKPPPGAGSGTVGAVALDARGNLAAATSTGGMTGKMPGRVGDTPIIGAGTYADNRSAAVSCTGTGEQFIRHAVAFAIASGSESGLPLEESARRVLVGRLNPDDGGIIAVSRRGEIAMLFTTEGMFRGAADSSGRFEIGIWKETTK